MTGKPMTQKQLAAMILTAMLSPLLRSVPRAPVRAAGDGAWLSAVPAVFLLLAMAAVHGLLLRQLTPGRGYADLIFRWLGPVAGRIVLVGYWAWFLFYAAFVLRSGAERLVSAVYPESPLLPFLLVMTTLCLLMALGTMRSSGRMAVLLQTVLLVSLGLVLVFSTPGISRENLLPIPWEQTGSILKGALPLAAIGGLMGTFPFLMAYTDPIQKPVRKTVPLILAAMGISFLLCVSVIGTFGAALTKNLSYPFFLMVRDISIFHVTQRIEAVVVVLWMFADFVLCSSMFRCAFECLRPVFRLPDPEIEPVLSMRGGRWLFWLGAVGVVILGCTVTDSSLDLVQWSDRIVPMLGILMIYGLLPVFLVIGRLRGKTKKSGTRS